jgi:hypothetical protein
MTTKAATWRAPSVEEICRTFDAAADSCPRTLQQLAVVARAWLIATEFDQQEPETLDDRLAATMARAIVRMALTEGEVR